MELLKTDFTRMTNNRHFQFGTEFNTLVVNTGAAALKIEPQYAAWLVHCREEDTALNRIQKTPHTEKLEVADIRRDKAFSGLVTANRALLNHFWDEMRDTAGRLKIVFDTFGNVAQKPMDDETAAITNLLQELKGPRQADIEK
ncbi:MAG: DUF6261 family protein, partial [Bacteroidales bacterium]|nr:DUF6261 family protein [Bacteroidales bacterium]